MSARARQLVDDLRKLAEHRGRLNAAREALPSAAITAEIRLVRDTIDAALEAFSTEEDDLAERLVTLVGPL